MNVICLIPKINKIMCQLFWWGGRGRTIPQMGYPIKKFFSLRNKLILVSKGESLIIISTVSHINAEIGTLSISVEKQLSTVPYIKCWVLQDF